jgi:hypothetical protein
VPRRVGEDREERQAKASNGVDQRKSYITSSSSVLRSVHRCRRCECGTHWEPLAEALAGELPDDLRAALETRRGVNARLLDGFETGAQPVPARCWVAAAAVEVRAMDNAG